jgi:hypothetical protein
MCYLHHIPKENGVPQGPVLNVTLLATAISRMVNTVGLPVATHLYVDDVAISCSSWCTVNYRMLDTGREYLLLHLSLDNKCSFSPVRTQCMHFAGLKGFHPLCEYKVSRCYSLESAVMANSLEMLSCQM